MLIERLKKEIERLRAELALARGEGQDDPLPDYEIERVKNMVDLFIEKNEELVFGDYRKVQAAFNFLRDRVGSKVISASGKPVKDEEHSRLKKILKQRDNEIAILVQELRKYEASPDRVFQAVPRQKQNAVSEVSTNADASTVYNSATNPIFDKFQREHPSWNWMEEQKEALKQKYQKAKETGEKANSLRAEISKFLIISRLFILAEHFKAALEELDEPREDLKIELHDKMKAYKDKVTKLKDLKIEIEHLQHLMEQARARIQRDFENYLEATQSLTEWRKDSGREIGDELSSETTSKMSLREDLDLPINVRRTSVRDDIKAFYRARDQVMNS